MADLPSKTVRIRNELLEIIEESLPYLDRKFGDAVNYVLKQGIEALGLPQGKKKPVPLKPIHERRHHQRSA